jgi:tripartite-type tricarboxylate transporter receptor subunit TctC
MFCEFSIKLLHKNKTKGVAVLKKKMTLVVGLISVLLVFSTLANGASKARSIDYPKQQLKIIVPGGPAGNMSVNARIVAKYLEKEIGKPVIVENRAGAGGIVGATEYLLEKANSDTIIVLPSLIQAVAPLYQKVQYKADDFVPIIGLTSEVSLVLTNPQKTGIKNFADLVKYGKDKIVKFGSGGPGTYNYLAEAALFKKAGIKANTIPHKSAGEGITNLLGGHTDVTLAAAPLVADYVKDGSLTPIFVFGRKPYTGFPGVKVPSIASLGYKVDFDSYVYFATRKGTAKKIINYLYTKINAVYQNPKFQKEMQKRQVSLAQDDPKTVQNKIKAASKSAKKLFNFLKSK